MFSCINSELRIALIINSELIIAKLILLCIMLKNELTYLKNLGVLTHSNIFTPLLTIFQQQEWRDYPDFRWMKPVLSNLKIKYFVAKQLLTNEMKWKCKWNSRYMKTSSNSVRNFSLTKGESLNKTFSVLMSRFFFFFAVKSKWKVIYVLQTDLGLD